MKDLFILILIIIIGFIITPIFRINDLFCLDDHPSRFFELWYVINKVIEEGEPLTWTNYGACGAPSLQFYPLGYTLLGAIIYFISFKKLETVQIYNILLLIVYYLPALTTYILYRKGFNYNRITSLFASFILMLFCGKWAMGCDLKGGVEIGMIAGRLSISLFPLVLYFGIKSLNKERRAIYTILTGISLAFTFLSHPWYIFPPFLGVIFLYFSKFPIKIKDILPLFFIIFLFLGLISFWFLPAFFHKDYLLRPYIYKSSLIDILRWVKELPLFIIFYLFSFIKVKELKDNIDRNIFSLCFIPPAILILAIINYYILYKIYEMPLIEPSRVRENFYYPMLLLSGVGFLQLTSLIKEKYNKERIFAHFLIGVLFILPILPFTHLPDKSMFYKKELYYSWIKEKYSLEELWNIIKENTEGRVLYPCSSFFIETLKGPIFKRKSCLYYLTPIFTEKSNIGGTHWHFPIMTYYFYGEKREEISDYEGTYNGVSLFGRRYEDMDEKFIFDMCCSLNIDTIVVAKKNKNIYSFFDRSKYFSLMKDLEYFKLYQIYGYKPSYLDFNKEEIKAKIIEYKGGRIKIYIKEAIRDTFLILKASYYPLWKAYINNKSYKIVPNEKGLIKGFMRIYIPKGKDYEVVLNYEKGFVEKLGIYISIFSLFITGIYLIISFIKSYKE